MSVYIILLQSKMKTKSPSFTKLTVRPKRNPKKLVIKQQTPYTATQ